jgi:hypothetical protein
MALKSATSAGVLLLGLDCKSAIALTPSFGVTIETEHLCAHHFVLIPSS